MAEIEPGNLLHTEAVARRLGVSPRTVQGWRQRGGGPPWIRVGERGVRYDADALERWIESRREGSDASR